jgi:hypothetical protein
MPLQLFVRTLALFIAFVTPTSFVVAQQQPPVRTLRDLTEGSPLRYQIKMDTTVGTAPFHYSVAAQPTSPADLSVDPDTGLVSWGKTVTQDQPYSFRIVIKDSSTPPRQLILLCSLKVLPAPLKLLPDDDSSYPAASVSNSSATPPAPVLPSSILNSDKKIKVSASPQASSVKVFYGGRTLSLSESDFADQKKNHPGQYELSVSPDNELFAGQKVEASQTVNGIESSLSNGITIAPVRRSGELANAIVGFEQAGASAAQSAQRFFFDFFISRPLGCSFRKREADSADPDLDCEPSLNWWGNVRVASYPQQINAPIATFATTLAGNIGNLKVNELAQAAEFTTGLEFSPGYFKRMFFGRSEDTRQRFSLKFIFGVGATGPLDPKSSLNIFSVPSQTSPQWPLFQKRYPGVTSQYIGFVTPDRDRFFRNYFGGIRLYTNYLSGQNRAPLSASPALVSISFGQNEIVTGGKLSGVVGRVEAFYPLPIGNRSRFSGFYLFGSAMMKIAGAKNIQPLILAAAPSTVQGSDPTVSIVSTPSTRDIYRIGFGIDLVSAIQAWRVSNASKPSPSQ